MALAIGFPILRLSYILAVISSIKGDFTAKTTELFIGVIAWIYYLIVFFGILKYKPSYRPVPPAQS